MVLPDGVHNLRGYVRPPAADTAAAFTPGGRLHGTRTGPWPEKPQHITDVERKEAAAAAAGGQEEAAAGKGGGKRGAAAASGVGDQVLQLNNELFMVPEALFRCVV